MHGHGSGVPLGKVNMLELKKQKRNLTRTSFLRQLVSLLRMSRYFGVTYDMGQISTAICRSRHTSMSLGCLAKEKLRLE